MAQSIGTAVYQGRKYSLGYIGKTKYGQRAKLSWFDGSKEFWVDAGDVEVLRTFNGTARPAAPVKPSRVSTPDACDGCGAVDGLSVGHGPKGYGLYCALCAGQTGPKGFKVEGFINKGGSNGA